MHSALSTLLRLLILAFAGLTLVAIGIGRMNHSKLGQRRMVHAPLVSVSNFLMPESRRFDALCVLDPESRQLKQMPLQRGDRLDMASVSPWHDAWGESQVVGRWMHRSGGDANGVCDSIGLARYSYPSGAVLDQIPMRITPVANPCWYPGTEARILFPAGDGKLYSFTFEPGPNDPISVGSRSPVEIPWRVVPPGEGRVMIHDIAWPSDPALGGRLLATLTVQQEIDGRMSFSESQLWSLQLDAGGTSILDAQPLFRNTSKAPPFHRRRSTLGRTSDGRLLLAYLGQQPGTSTYDLFVAPVEFDPETRTPWVASHQNRRMAENCMLIQPAFTADGQWLVALGPDDGQAGVAVRCARVGVPASSLAGLQPIPGHAEDGSRHRGSD